MRSLHACMGKSGWDKTAHLGAATRLESVIVHCYIGCNEPGEQSRTWKGKPVFSTSVEQFRRKNLAGRRLQRWAEMSHFASFF